jgi:hypothetical protein
LNHGLEMVSRLGFSGCNRSATKEEIGKTSGVWEFLTKGKRKRKLGFHFWLVLFDRKGERGVNLNKGRARVSPSYA